MKRNVASFVAILALALGACTKDKNANGTLNYQLSVEGNTSVVNRMAGNANSGNERTLLGSITWTSGTATASEIKFKANGDDKLEYKSNVSQTVNLFNPTSSLGLITIPQGSYDKVEYKIVFNTSGTSVMELNGNFTNSSNVITPITVRIDSPLELKYEVKVKTSFALNTFTVVNTIPLGTILNGVTEVMLNNAQRTGSTIIISSTSNTALYNMIVNSTKLSFKVHIK